MKILVTGAGGFVGEYLVKLLVEHKHDITAVGLNHGSFLEELNIPTYTCDITDYVGLAGCMKEVSPDVVIHLAAISNVPMSWDKPVLTVDVNIKGTVNALMALAEVNSNGVFLNIGSSDEYGLAAKLGKALTEDVLCQPQNPYSISKYCAEQMVLQLGKKLGIKVIHTRSFNHFGPGQAKGFVTSDFASQIAAIERGEQEPIIRVGDLSAYRDFSFVSDIVEAYVDLIEYDVEPGVYNICSGTARKIEDVLNILVSLSTKNITVEKDVSRFRPSEVPYFVGNCDKLKKATSWNPKYDFKEGMAEVLAYWRNK